MGERVDNEAGYILHTRPYRETSLIVDVISRHHGRLALVARGARRPMSSIKSRLLAFQPLTLSWFGKGGGLRTLHDAEWQGGDLRLQGGALMCGFYLNELLLKLLPPDDPHEALYDRYEETLAALSAGNDAEPILRRFELDLLSELGYAQTLTHDAEGKPLRPEHRYGYAFDRGVVEAGEGGATYSGKTLLAMAAGDFSDPRTLAEGKLLMRALLNHYLSDKPLLTRQLLIDLQGL
jgi:DNA repair protein RecO (recombination protein O)